MYRDYDKDQGTGQTDPTTGTVLQSLFAKVSWTFTPAAQTETGLTGWDVVLHTGTDPEALTARVTSIRHTPSADTRDFEVLLPSRASGTATVNASVRGVFTFGRGPWTTTGATATQTAGSIITPGVNTVNSVNTSGYATGAVISGNSITLGAATTTLPGVLDASAPQTIGGDKAWAGAQTFSGAVTFTGAVSGISIPAIGQGDEIFGTGSDGDLTLSSGSTTLARDTYYNNLTLSGTGQLITANYRVHVNGTLDVSAAPSAAIVTQNQTNQNGGNSTGFTNGAASTLANSGSMPSSSSAGSTGAVGVASSSNGNNAAMPSVGAWANNGGWQTKSGAGGTGATGNQGGNGLSVLTQARIPIGHLATQVVLQSSGGATLNALNAGTGGPGGNSGGSDGTGFSGGGGGGGSGAGTLWIVARTIARGTNTNVGVLSVAGGNGGNGGDGASGGGGGAGGSGGGAGVLYLGFKTLTGSTITNGIDLSGGTGGTGGNAAAGPAKGGGGGGSGGSGVAHVFDIGGGTNTHTASIAGTDGTTTSSSTTGLSGFSNTKRINL